MTADQPTFERPDQAPGDGFPAVRGAGDRSPSGAGAAQSASTAPARPPKSAAWLRFFPADQWPLALIMGVALAFGLSGPFSPGSAVLTGIAPVDVIAGGLISGAAAYVAWLVAGRRRAVLGFLGLSTLAYFAAGVASLVIEPLLVGVLSLISGAFSWPLLANSAIGQLTVVAFYFAIAAGPIVVALIVKDPAHDGSSSLVPPVGGPAGADFPPLPASETARTARSGGGLVTRLRDALGFGPGTDPGPRKLAFWSAALVASWGAWLLIRAILGDIMSQTGALTGSTPGQAVSSVLGIVAQYGTYVVLFVASFWALRHWDAPTGMWIPFAAFSLTGVVLSVVTMVPKVGLITASTGLLSGLANLSSTAPSWVPMVLVEIAAVYVATSGRPSQGH